MPLDVHQERPPLFCAAATNGVIADFSHTDKETVFRSNRHWCRIEFFLKVSFRPKRAVADPFRLRLA